MLLFPERGSYPLTLQDVSSANKRGSHSFSLSTAKDLAWQQSHPSIKAMDIALSNCGNIHSDRKKFTGFTNAFKR
jgi:hypothetical protein